MMTEQELKPCPFCGGKADIQYLKPVVEGGLDEFRVRCVAIGCGGAVTGWMSEPTAIKAWNTRQHDKVRRVGVKQHIDARKMRTHCKNWTVDQLLDELIALDEKYNSRD
jgi:hypothetical protein